MPTFVSRENHSTAAPMSESDNDDDNEQNSSFNQQNESMIHKVKDVVSKLLHPSFLFSTSGDTIRPKRKREISAEENGDQQPSEVVTVTDSITINGHSTALKSKYNHQPKSDDEPQLTDDEDNNDRSVSPTEQNLTDTEQQKKRRRTTHYQHVTSAITTNGIHEDERSSLTLSSTNNVGSSSNRRIVDNGLVTSNTTPVLLQTSTEQRNNEGTNRLTSAKQRFNIPSTNRGLTSNYDPSQSPLFSVAARKPAETPMSLNRTTTNLKSNLNEFSGNYLLATGLVNRTQPIIQNTQQTPSSNVLNRSSSNERQLLGVNYASINSRRLPYIERLRRRTLQDCIRLNRTLDSEPLSISTIEEHASTIAASPIRKPMKASEKECGIQCNISTTNDSMEPSRKIPRTFPPADIRNEALSLPSTEKAQSTCQTDSFIQTNSSITIEPVQQSNDITKPKVLGNITPFSWPKFARAQEDFAKKFPEKCRADILPAQQRKAATPSIVEKSSANSAASIVTPTNVSIAAPKVPIFGVSPPRSTKSVAGPIWKCPSCSMEHPAQTASCSICHRINPDYKRLSVIESTPVSLSSKLPDVIVEESAVSKPTITTQSTTSTESTSLTLPTTTKENVLTMPPPLMTTTPLSTTNTLPAFNFMATTSKENTTTSTPTAAPLFGTNTAPMFGATVTTPTPLFGTLTSNADKTATTAFPSFGSLSSTSAPTTTTAASSSSVTSLTTATTSTAKLPTSITFGAFGSTPIATTTAAPSITSTTSADKAPIFAFGASSTASSTTTTSSSAIPTNLFPFSSNTAASTTTTPSTLPPPATTTSGLPLSGGFSSTLTPFSVSTTSAAPLFGSVSSSTPSSSGFSFPTMGTTTTTSSSTPFAFGASSPPKTFAPVISSTGTTPAPAFGATASFGSNPSTADKTSTSASSFSGFGSATGTTPLFTFGAASNTTMNPMQPTVPPTGTTSGFAFTPSSTSAATPASTFGSGPTSFAFGSGSAAPSSNTPFQFSAAPSFSFGAGSTAPTNSSPFQFSAATAGGANSSFSSGFPAAPDKNPFSVSEDTSNTRSAKAGRPVIKAKRQAKS